MRNKYLYKDLDWFPPLVDLARAEWRSRLIKLCPRLFQSEEGWRHWHYDPDDPWSMLQLVSDTQRKAIFVLQIPPNLLDTQLIAYAKASKWFDRNKRDQLDSLFVAGPLESAISKRLGNLLCIWANSDTTLVAMKEKIDIMFEGRIGGGAIDDGVVQTDNTPEFDSLARELEYSAKQSCGRKSAESLVWRKWRDSNESGNPWLCYWSPASSKAVRVIRREFFDGQPKLDSWMDIIDYSDVGGPHRSIELTISLIQSSSTAIKHARQLMDAWMSPTCTENDMAIKLAEMNFPQ